MYEKWAKIIPPQRGRPRCKPRAVIVDPLAGNCSGTLQKARVSTCLDAFVGRSAIVYSNLFAKTLAEPASKVEELHTSNKVTSDEHGRKSAY